METLIGLLISGYLVYLFVNDNNSDPTKLSKYRLVDSLMHAALVAEGKREPRRVHVMDLKEHEISRLSDWDRVIYQLSNKYNMRDFAVEQLNNEDLKIIIAVAESQDAPMEASLIKDIAKNILAQRISAPNIIE